MMEEENRTPIDRMFQEILVALDQLEDGMNEVLELLDRRDNR